MIKRDIFEYFKKEPDVMQVKDVVRLLHCSKNTVYKLIHEGRIDTIKVGRSILIPKTALVEMMVNERYYQIISPYSPDSLWTMKERNRIIASNKKSKEASSNLQTGALIRRLCKSSYSSVDLKSSGKCLSKYSIYESMSLIYSFLCLLILSTSFWNFSVL